MSKARPLLLCADEKRGQNPDTRRKLGTPNATTKWRGRNSTKKKHKSQQALWEAGATRQAIERRNLMRTPRDDFTHYSGSCRVRCASTCSSRRRTCVKQEVFLLLRLVCSYRQKVFLFYASDNTDSRKMAIHLATTSPFRPNHPTNPERPEHPNEYGTTTPTSTEAD